MSDRLQQEIDEILGKFEKFPLKEPRGRRIRRTLSRWASSIGQWGTSHLPHITVGRVMLVGIALILAAYFFEFGGQSIARTVIVAGLVLFAAAFIFSLRRRYPRLEQRWRGRPVEVHPQSGVGLRLRSWWGRWRSRRRSHR